jgi:DNA-3-methyladenine glycosylase
MILKRDFYLQDPFDAVRHLLGAYLCREVNGDIVRARICEVELYLENDRACHAFGGKCTDRTRVMFGPGGYSYVYLCYGLHNMLNIVLGDSGHAGAVLIRALEMKDGDGPAKLTKALNITRAENNMDLTRGEKLWLEERDAAPEISVGKRIGVDYAGSDAGLMWRFAIKDSPFVSKPI